MFMPILRRAVTWLLLLTLATWLLPSASVAEGFVSEPAIPDSNAQDSPIQHPSFQNDIQPVLTRFGCNSGGCHGKLAGQNGFKLSLRGYAPEDDYRSLVSGELGRRINRFAPDQSLLLLKATGRIPHGGGRLFDPGSEAYQTLHDWIVAGAPASAPNTPHVVAIDAAPSLVTMQPGDRHAINVRAMYSDGTHRQVTWLSRFQSNDASYATVDVNGQIEARRAGEVALVVSFADHVDTVVVSVPYEHDIDDRQYAATYNLLDEPVMEKLKSLNIPPSEPCDDATYLRRVMLDLIGTLPTSDEVQGFLNDTSPKKRERLVEVLLERPEFVDFWTLQLSDLLQNRKERDHDVRGAKGVRAFQAWIRQQVAQNRPWDQLVHDVITAMGPASENPAVGYYIVTVGEKQAPESEVGDSVAQAFLGTRIGCAKCHNHPLEKYTQDDYFRFMAFFSQVALDRKSPADGVTTLHHSTRQMQDLQRRLASEQQELGKLQGAEAVESKQVDEKVARIEQLTRELEELRRAPPVVRQPRTGELLSAQGLDRQPIEIASGADPRNTLATWMTNPANRTFSGAIVNRLWKHFFAVGLIEPVDDLRETNPPSNQHLYDLLIDEFVASEFDLRHIMKRMVTSRTYQLASDTLPENEHDAKFYSHYYARRLPAEVLLDAIVQATGVPDEFQGYPVGTRAIQLPAPHTGSYFLTTFGRSDRVTACACERASDVTLSQLLHLQNSEGMARKFQDPQGNLQQRLHTTGSEEDLITDVYLMTLSRLPQDDEKAAILAAFQSDDRTEVAVDLLWALLNAKEFTFNH
jgi:hypothetical protein